MEHYNFILRLLICFGLSFCIELEREFRGSSAELRTNVIVCIGAFLFISASFNSYDDRMRIPAQVISGIGFLGAGSIIIHDNKISGLNTDATMWVVAAIGVLTGLKLIFEAITGTITIIFTNLFVRKIKKAINPDRYLDEDL